MKNKKQKQLLHLLICFVTTFICIYLTIFIGGWRLFQGGDPILLEIAASIVIGFIIWLIYELFIILKGEIKVLEKRIEDLESKKDREQYLGGKNDFIVYNRRKALVNYYLGKIVEIKIDRVMGSKYPSHIDIIYPINYGYIPGVLGGDGEELDVYLLGVDKPVKEYIARVIGIVHRHNDVEDKLVAAPEGMNFTQMEIKEAVHFQEQYYHSEIEVI